MKTQPVALFEIWLMVSGGGGRVHVGFASSLEAAHGIIVALDHLLEDLDSAALDALHASHPLHVWEGADLYATDPLGTVWELQNEPQDPSAWVKF